MRPKFTGQKIELTDLKIKSNSSYSIGSSKMSEAKRIDFLKPQKSIDKDNERLRKTVSFKSKQNSHLKQRSRLSVAANRRNTMSLPSAASPDLPRSVLQLIPDSELPVKKNISADDKSALMTDSDITTQMHREDDKAKKNVSTAFFFQDYFIHDFLMFYGSAPGVQEGTCIIMSNNGYKIMWDIFILALLLFISLVVPWRLAFSGDDNEEGVSSWLIFFWIIDSFFLVDIVLTFFTSVTDEKDFKEITDKKRIALIYLKKWFIIDVLSILPVDVFLFANQNADETARNSNVLFRFAKIGKVYKLIRMLRLAKILKILKSKRTVVNHFASELKISSGVERMIFFVMFFMLLFHIFACMFIFLREIESESGGWLEDSTFYSYSNTDQYITACYFIMTTISTVGYGDISASTRLERVFMIALMLIGVSSFTFISGALSSILSNYDQT